MVSRISLTAVYEPVENGWTQAHIEELPGVITAAPTLAEAKELLADALREYLLALRESAARLPRERQEGVPADRGTVDILIDAT